MSKNNFFKTLEKELERIEGAKTAKRYEKVIEGFTKDDGPRAIIGGKNYRVFNSNDYLGLRFHSELKEGEKEATEKYGAGPGAVRFISGTFSLYRELEQAIARFHGREDAIIFSSAFAANIGVIASLGKGQSKDSYISSETLIVSDELNHRSIIEGIRVLNFSKEQRQIYKHRDYQDLERILEENQEKFKRVMVITDGVFSMIGAYADLKEINKAIHKYDGKYEEGIMLVVDDSHGVGVFGEKGRGVEEVSGAKSDVLVATFGKAFGSDGGYAAGDKVVIDYLRESAATYIYSNPVSPGVAGASLYSVNLMLGDEGKKLLDKLKDNLALFKELIKKANLEFAADSIHPIQPVLTGDPVKSKLLTGRLFAEGILVTSINYPIVPKGRDEIRVQINASHSREDIRVFTDKLSTVSREIGII
ncbi:MAG: 7-keto-8-aminopelargonate synthetase [Candidatus Gottesmanbacteria bacterium GW2011_GWC2_39_8]|uniref:7-keto-8-aminopelargonate synthetase n=1 Tax=Candidatus Gottesmanbacteria bacterium GW2011_GWC2_39_8 TaxID=1618450 RepID=A0A0G0SBN7_9BACT|nr:MAG: 7-keto-8-aminopelargonate synthetase [Candidatus Gottesmanbacteria bacterium GW2011_GWC2_39_8]